MTQYTHATETNHAHPSYLFGAAPPSQRRPEAIRG